MNTLKRAHDSGTLGDSPYDVERDNEEIVFYKIENKKINKRTADRLNFLWGCLLCFCKKLSDRQN